MKKLILAILACVAIQAKAELGEQSLELAPDTLCTVKRPALFESRWVQSTYLGVPLFIGGIIEKRENRHFRSLRNDFFPNYNNKIDNYLQYTPVILPVALKACGLESRSSWGKMMTAEGTSFLLVTIFAQGIKRTFHEERPDGSNLHSFPSGHTASAFMAATVLSKEYAHYSPWISIGAYSMATATGVMRMLNNRHWMSDVLSGAGLGLVSAEFGYWITDMLFPNEPKSYNPEKSRITKNDGHPSFFGTYAGFYLPLSHLNVSPGYSLEATTGGTFGFEGAWYFSRHFGIGGRTAFSNASFILQENQPATTEKGQIEHTSHFYNFQAGAYAHLPLTKRLFAEGKALTGIVRYSKRSLSQFSLAKRTRPMATSGLSLGVRANNYFDVKFTLDYSLMAPRQHTERNFTHTLIASSSVNVRF